MDLYVCTYGYVWDTSLHPAREVHMDLDRNLCLEIDIGIFNGRQETNLLSVSKLVEIGHVLGIGHTIKIGDVW